MDAVLVAMIVLYVVARRRKGGNWPGYTLRPWKIHAHFALVVLGAAALALWADGLARLGAASRGCTLHKPECVARARPRHG